MTRFGCVVGLLALGLLACLGLVECRVGVGEGEQEWGYATVRPGAHMFWWLYLTTHKTVGSVYERPLLIWLQGGPGASSTGYGNFEELGPYTSKLEPRNHTWVKNYNVLFIDNPVGSGFSYADNPEAFARNNSQIAKDLLNLMKAFYKEQPKFRQVPVYITSESYGGKMAAEFALEWHKAEKSGAIDSNLRGVGLGDSWISPIDSVLTWAPFLLQTGMVDSDGYKQIEKAALQTKQAVEKGQWEEATALWGYTENVILKATGNIDFYNILTKMRGRYRSNTAKSSEVLASAILRKVEDELDDDVVLDKLMNTKVKETLKLNVTWGDQSRAVFSSLYGDFMKPVTDIVKRLLDETYLKVFVYTGQLDLIVDTPGTLLWVERLKWKGADKWHASKRHTLLAKGVIEGYSKSYGNLSFYWINRAGHMVPADNPAATSAMLEDLTN